MDLYKWFDKVYITTYFIYFNNYTFQIIILLLAYDMARDNRWCLVHIQIDWIISRPFQKN